MIRLFFGKDQIAVRAAALAAVDALIEVGASLTTVDRDNYESGVLPSLAEGVSLFTEPQVYVLDTPSVDQVFYGELLDHLPTLADSAHTFIIIEGSLLAAAKKKFSKQADSVEEFKGGGEERFNVFGLSEALARRDKKGLWLLLRQAILAGIPLEEIVGILWWQLKTLRLVSLTDSAEAAGLKPFVYQKAKRALSKFSKAELTKLSQALLELQHKSRLGECELDIALERWVLQM